MIPIINFIASYYTSFYKVKSELNTNQIYFESNPCDELLEIP